jgi:hypothetical protein
LIPELSSWSASEKEAVRETIRAKSGTNEMRYLRLLQRHDRLREALLKLGSPVRGLAKS